MNQVASSSRLNPRLRNLKTEGVYCDPQSRKAAKGNEQPSRPSFAHLPMQKVVKRKRVGHRETRRFCRITSYPPSYYQNDITTWFHIGPLLFSDSSFRHTKTRRDALVPLTLIGIPVTVGNPSVYQ